MSRVKVFLSFQNRKRFYNAYILPHFDLCCVIWGNCTSVMADKLVKLQKRATRAILDVDFTLPLETMFTQMGDILPFHYVHVLILLYNVVL